MEKTDVQINTPRRPEAQVGRHQRSTFCDIMSRTWKLGPRFYRTPSCSMNTWFPGYNRAICLWSAFSPPLRRHDVCNMTLMMCVNRAWDVLLASCHWLCPITTGVTAYRAHMSHRTAQWVTSQQDRGHFLPGDSEEESSSTPLQLSRVLWGS